MSPKSGSRSAGSAMRSDCMELGRYALEEDSSDSCSSMWAELPDVRWGDYLVVEEADS